MSTQDRQALSRALRDADAMFPTIDVGTITDPCPDDFVDVPITLYDNIGRRMPAALYLARCPGREERGSADAGASIVLRRIRKTTTIELFWREKPGPEQPAADDPDEALFLYRESVYVPDPSLSTDEAVRQRLDNLGYRGARSFEGNVAAFQRDYDLPDSGEAIEAAPKVREVHDDDTVEPFVDPSPSLTVHNEA